MSDSCGQCVALAVARGLCRRHYQAWWKRTREERHTERKLHACLARLGLKKCSTCRALKPLSGFYADSSHRDGLTSRCRVCVSAADARRYASNPRPFLDRNRRSHFVKPKGRPGWRTIGAVTEDLVRAKFEYWGGRCWMCGSDDRIEVDHVKPFAKGGPHVLSNVRPACRSCNAGKGARWPIETKRGW